MRFFQMTALAAVLAATALSPVLAKEGRTLSQITVTGEGVVDAAPDVATLSLGVTTQGETAVEAMKANTAALSTVMERLKAAGVAERDLQTNNLSLNPNWTGYDSSSSGSGSSQPRIAGYTVSNQLTVRIRALDTLGAVLDAAITDGANTLNGLTFGLSDPRPAMDEARKSAVADARARATLLVEAAGAKLGKIVSIAENNGYHPPVVSFARAADSVQAMPVAGGEVSTTAGVTIVFEIEQ